MVVDLHRRRRMADRVLRLFVDIQVDRCADECWNTLPIAWKQNQEAYQLRYVFGYAMDGSDLPCYILWPTRTAEQSFWCIDAWKGDWVRLDKCSHMAPLGIEHFFDAFCFEPQEQPHAKLWTFPPVMFQRIPILNRCTRTSSRLLQGASQLKGRHLLLSEESMRTWLRKRRVCRMLRVGGQGCRTTPPRTLNVCTDVEASSVASDQDRFDTAYDAGKLACTTLTSDGTPEVSPVRMRLGFRYWMDRRSCKSWCICLELGL